MFVYTQAELFESFMKYPSFHLVSLPSMMQFILISSLPLLSEQEKQDMDILKQQYDKQLKKLSCMNQDKKKTAQECMDLLLEALSLYNQSFDRIANLYFENF